MSCLIVHVDEAVGIIQRKVCYSTPFSHCHDMGEQDHVLRVAMVELSVISHACTRLVYVYMHVCGDRLSRWLLAIQTGGYNSSFTKSLPSTCR